MDSEKKNLAIWEKSPPFLEGTEKHYIIGVDPGKPGGERVGVVYYGPKGEIIETFSVAVEAVNNFHRACKVMERVFKRGKSSK